MATDSAVQALDEAVAKIGDGAWWSGIVDGDGTHAVIEINDGDKGIRAPDETNRKWSAFVSPLEWQHEDTGRTDLGVEQWHAWPPGEVYLNVERLKGGGYVWKVFVPGAHLVHDGVADELIAAQREAIRGIGEARAEPAQYEEDVALDEVTTKERSDHSPDPDGWETIGSIGVDSGLILLADPCHVLDPQRYMALLEQPVRAHGLRDTSCLTPEGGALSVVTPTAEGDGLYDIEARYDPNEGRIIELRVVFS
jgi:hypothetical protein